MKRGKFVISLDFELLWGVRDKKTKEDYGENILGVHQAIPRLLQSFGKYGVKATFSTVGFLFFKNKAELEAAIPSQKPGYAERDLSPYEGHFEQVGPDADTDLYHYAPKLIQEIQSHPEHELGTHTFSHYYCLEPGQTIDEFRADLKAAIEAASAYGIRLTSLIFPRNQFNDSYLKVCEELGIICYRGNEHSWIYKAKNGSEESRIRRAFRLLDAYVNISGHNTYDEEYLKSKFPVDIPSSRFLRPYSPRLSMFEPMRLHRIKSGMTDAARNGRLYHLWWHPHNFGVNQDENFEFLDRILDHFRKLNGKYGFESVTMSGLAKAIMNGK